MAESIELLIQITKKIGGPDFSNVELYKESKYGVIKKKLALYQTLISDPIFCDFVDWISENFNKNCVLNPNHIVNYENILNSSNKNLYTEDLATVIEISNHEWKSKSIEDLNIDLEEAQLLYNLYDTKNKDLKHQETNLNSYYKEICLELEELEKNTVDYSLKLEKSALKTFSSSLSMKSTLDDVIKTLSQVRISENTFHEKNSSNTSTHTSRAAHENLLSSYNSTKVSYNENLQTNFNYFIFDKYFSALNKLNFESLFDKISCHIKNNLHSHKTICDYFKCDDSINLHKIFDNLIELTPDKNQIGVYRKDLSTLYRLSEIAAADLEFSKFGLNFFKLLEGKESHLLVADIDYPDDLIKMENEVKELLEEIYSTYRVNLDCFINTLVVCECISNFINNNKIFLNHLHHAIKPIDNFMSLFSMLLEISDSQYQNCQNIQQGLQDISSFIDKCQKSSSPPKTTSTHVTKNKLITSLLMEYCASFNQLSDENPINLSNAISSACSKTSDFHSKISQHVNQNLFKLIEWLRCFIDFTSSSPSKDQCLFISNNIIDERNQMMDSIEELKKKFEETISDLEWKKKVVENDKTRKRYFDNIYLQINKK